MVFVGPVPGGAAIGIPLFARLAVHGVVFKECDMQARVEARFGLLVRA